MACTNSLIHVWPAAPRVGEHYGECRPFASHRFATRLSYTARFARFASLFVPLAVLPSPPPAHKH